MNQLSKNEWVAVVVGVLIVLLAFTFLAPIFFGSAPQVEDAAMLEIEAESVGIPQ